MWLIWEICFHSCKSMWLMWKLCFCCCRGYVQPVFTQQSIGGGRREQRGDKSRWQRGRGRGQQQPSPLPATSQPPLQPQHLPLVQHSLLGNAGEGWTALRPPWAHAQHFSTAPTWQWDVPWAPPVWEPAGACAKNSRKDWAGTHPESRRPVCVGLQSCTVPSLRQLSYLGGAKLQVAGCVESDAWLLRAPLWLRPSGGAAKDARSGTVGRAVWPVVSEDQFCERVGPMLLETVHHILPMLAGDSPQRDQEVIQAPLCFFFFSSFSSVLGQVLVEQFKCGSKTKFLLLWWWWHYTSCWMRVVLFLADCCCFILTVQTTMYLQPGGKLHSVCTLLLRIRTWLSNVICDLRGCGNLCDRFDFANRILNQTTSVNMMKTFNFCIVLEWVLLKWQQIVFFIAASMLHFC